MRKKPENILCFRRSERNDTFMKKLFKSAAVLMGCAIAAGSVCGCGNGWMSKNGDKEDSLKWYIFDNPANVNAKDVYAEASKQIKEKTGADVSFVPVESGNYEAKMQVLNASAEQLDIVFVSNWANNYYMNISKNTLVPLDDMLKNVTPKLYESLPDYLWEGAKVNGKIYAVPNQQIAARETRFAIPEQNINLLGIDTEDYLSRTGDYKTYLGAAEEYLTLLNSKTGTYASLGRIWGDGMSLFGMEEVLGSYLPGAIRYSDGELKLINQYKSEEFKYYIKKRREWVQKGLVQPEVEDTRTLPGLNDKSVPIPELLRVNAYKPGVESELETENKYKPAWLIKTKGYLTSGGIVATMNGISATSKNPELALKVLECVNTDKKVYNTISFGIEGVNYKKTGENRIEKDTKNVYNMASWAVGNVFNAYLEPGQDDDIWEKTKEINDTAQRSPLLGFNPNMDNLKTQIAGCNSAIDEFLEVLDYGVVDVDGAYTQFLNKLNAAGADKIVEEVQKQIDSWKQAK